MFTVDVKQQHNNNNNGEQLSFCTSTSSIRPAGNITLSRPKIYKARKCIYHGCVLRIPSKPATFVQRLHKVFQTSILSLVMPISDPRGHYFHPLCTSMIVPYNPRQLTQLGIIICAGELLTIQQKAFGLFCMQVFWHL